MGGSDLHREWAVQVCQEDAEWPARPGRPDKSELESKEVVWGGKDSPDGSTVVVLDLSSVQSQFKKKSGEG